LPQHCAGLFHEGALLGAALAHAWFSSAGPIGVDNELGQSIAWPGPFSANVGFQAEGTADYADGTDENRATLLADIREIRVIRGQKNSRPRLTICFERELPS
jgi:hypothetical protein